MYYSKKIANNKINYLRKTLIFLNNNYKLTVIIFKIKKTLKLTFYKKGTKIIN